METHSRIRIQQIIHRERAIQTSLVSFGLGLFAGYCFLVAFA